VQAVLADLEEGVPGVHLMQVGQLPRLDKDRQVELVKQHHLLG
jgi:hypothetical protein